MTSYFMRHWTSHLEFDLNYGELQWPIIDLIFISERWKSRRKTSFGINNVRPKLLKWDTFNVLNSSFIRFYEFMITIRHDCDADTACMIVTWNLEYKQRNKFFSSWLYVKPSAWGRCSAFEIVSYCESLMLTMIWMCPRSWERFQIVDSFWWQIFVINAYIHIQK